MAKLKVFRTAIGFHDAYIAAPSKKAALAAWGARADLFARGVAEQVDDPRLMKAPLASPGEIVRVSRGSAADNLAALPREKRAPAKSAKPSTKPASTAKRPSRAALDKAETALAALEKRQADERARIDERIKALERDRAALAKRHDTAAAKLQRARDRAAETYDAKLARWRES